MRAATPRTSTTRCWWWATARRKAPSTGSSRTGTAEPLGARFYQAGLCRRLRLRVSVQLGRGVGQQGLRAAGAEHEQRLRRRQPRQLPQDVSTRLPAPNPALSTSSPASLRFGEILLLRRDDPPVPIVSETPLPRRRCRGCRTRPGRLVRTGPVSRVGTAVQDTAPPALVCEINHCWEPTAGLVRCAAPAPRWTGLGRWNSRTREGFYTGSLF